MFSSLCSMTFGGAAPVARSDVNSRPDSRPMAASAPVERMADVVRGSPDRHNGTMEGTTEPPPWLRDIVPGQVSPLIESDERVIRVQAGPGTGKTLVIRRRVLRLLHPDGLGLDPNQVLVCAFNRAIAKDLTDEIGRELRPHGLPMPVIKTVHALCSEIVRTDARLLLPHEIEAMIYDVLTQYPELGTTYTRHGDAMRALREHEAGLTSHTALAQAVRRWLAEHGAGLVGDAPRNVERAMAAGDGPVTRYGHVIVDEFQDLTSTEAQVVLKLRPTTDSSSPLGTTSRASMRSAAMATRASPSCRRWSKARCQITRWISAGAASPKSWYLRTA